MKDVTIVGAGLAGTLLALYLARRDYQVHVHESRDDIRRLPPDEGRSINLALSCRGITSLEEIGLRREVDNIIVPMRARAIHEKDGNISYQAFGRHNNEYINAVLRSELNCLLLNEAEKKSNIKLSFNSRLTNIDFKHKTVCFDERHKKSKQIHYDILIGADGAASKVRDALINAGVVHSTREFLPASYKELSISRSHGKYLAEEHLHLWPRDSFMLLGNPNRDGSITGSLFMSNTGENSFDAIKSESDLITFFNGFFSDVVNAMPNLAGEFFSNPTGHMSTVKCSGWHYEDHCLLIGDAAHGIVPFFGQGMNCAFEDCRVLDQLLQSYHDDWAQVMSAFFAARKLNTDAVAEMSMDNYREIQHDIRDEKFNLKKQMHQMLMQRYPSTYISKHVLVMFTNTPYSKAYQTGEIQKNLINHICSDIHSISQIDWPFVDQQMAVYDKKLAEINLLSD